LQVECEKELETYTETPEKVSIQTNTSPAVVSVGSPGHMYLCAIKALTSDGGFGFSSHINFSLSNNLDQDGTSRADYGDADVVDDSNIESSSKGRTRTTVIISNYI
jgi:hypothetical protein